MGAIFHPIPFAKEKAMRKRFMIPLFALIAAAIVAGGGNPAAADEKKEGTMKSDEAEVRLSAYPKVTTSGEGKATFDLSKDGSSLHYKLDVEKVSDVTMAHIHVVGEGGAPGPIVAWLYPEGGQAPGLKEGKVSGKLAEGKITADRIGGPMKGKSVKELLAAINGGKAGVAVHTKTHPKGELWGTHGDSGRGKMGHKESGMEKKEDEKRERKSGY